MIVFCAESYIYLEKKIHKKLSQLELLVWLAQICTRSFVGWGSAPDPTGEAYSAPQIP